MFALTVALRLFAPFDAATAADQLAAAPAVRIDSGRPAAPSVDVASPADLSAIATTLGRPLLRDDSDRYVVFDRVVTYACDAPARPDDVDPELIVQRDDDQPETVRNRLSVYREETKPLEDYFDDRDLLVPVDGEGDIQDVYDRLTTVLDDQIAAPKA